MHNREIHNAGAGLSALFIDFENIFYFLKNHYHNPPELEDYAFEMLRNLKEKLDTEQGLQTIIMKAYADFERLATPSQGSLYLMGIETHNVMGTEHKNAADMKLCIDALEVLYTRPEIKTFIFVAGDRDYIPVIQHLKRQGRQVLASAFRENVSGDLLQNIGQSNFIDAIELLSEKTGDKLKKRETDHLALQAKSKLIREKGLPSVEQAKTVAEGGASAAEVAQTAKISGSFTKKAAKADGHAPAKPKQKGEESPSEFTWIQSVKGANELKCLELILENIGHRPELWIGPFIRKLNDHFPLLADYERKMLIERLTQAGAIRVEKRSGDPYDFTVILINYNHPDVRKLNVG